ncbi:hypothetical protein Hypma_008302 [Hypsizygus marmoreus]|uniref:Uncharacterized protein n=1 Tax=Hypsizygus marmoreus TaxID=39966 RepID=A0A369JQI4_HYPMA|nr:hypothetical protein Hypma_008302 [Hypsizygus marmoreus]
MFNDTVDVIWERWWSVHLENGDAEVRVWSLSKVDLSQIVLPNIERPPCITRPTTARLNSLTFPNLCVSWVQEAEN